MEQATNEPIIMYSTLWCSDCRRSKRWLYEHDIAFQEIDIDEDDEAAAIVTAINRGSRTIPTIVFPDGAVLVEPSNRALALQIERSLGITTPDAERAHGL